MSDEPEDFGHDDCGVCDEARALLKPEQVFRPQWPEGLNHEAQRVACDDKGAKGRCWFQVMVGNDGDAYMLAFEGCDQYGSPLPNDAAHPVPGIRVRTFQGGGRNQRTHQALLWLALAIKLDRENPL